MNTGRIVGGAVALCFASQGAHAYNYLSCSQGGSLSFPGDITFNYADNLTAAEKTAISRGMLRATLVSDTSVTTNDNGDDDYEGDNGENEIYRDNIPTADCRNWVFVNTCNVAEVDMRFGNPTWITDDNSQHLPYAEGRNMTGTAVHEIGHCLGMAHSNDRYNMMGDDWTHLTRNQTLAYYGPGEDMSDGLIDLHGKKSGNDANRDVGITVFRYAGASGQYSRHEAGTLLEAGVTLPVVGSYEGQDVYEVVSGHTIQMELTLENNGEKDSEFPAVGLYLSGNSFISSSDTLLRTTSISLGRNAPLETTLSVTIPAGTLPGNYFLGAYIDHDNQIPEVTSGNNAAYYPVSIIPPASDMTFPFFAVSKTTLALNEPFTVYTIVRNEGEIASTAGSINYYRSSTPQTSKLNLHDSSSLAPLDPGGQRSGNAALQATAVERDFYLGGCVEDVSNELVTNNNCSTGVYVEVKAPPPTVTTLAATDIQTTEATFNASVNPNGATATVYFDWGTTEAYGNSIPYGQTGPEPGVVNVSRSITGLSCGTTYHYRARATEADGDVYGADRQFTTATCPGC